MKMLRTIPMALAFVLGSSLAVVAQSVDLRLLHINDVYEISAKRGVGGFPQLMTLLKQERAGAKHHLTTFGGDLISPSVMSGLTKGSQMIELMNAIGVDAAGLGNHEFDFGDDILKQRMMASKFTWLASNTFDVDGKPFGGAQPVMVRQVGELKIGLFSLLTVETTYLSSPGAGVKFTPALDAARVAVKTLQGMGADLIIAITHLDIAQDLALARGVRGIGVIAGGHDHDPISIFEGSTLILKAGHDAHYLAVADLHIEKKKGRRGMKVSMRPVWRFLSTAGVAPDGEIQKTVARFEKDLDGKLAVPVGKTDVSLDSRRATVRTRESNIGNLITDAMRQATGADVALTNGGGIRGDRTYEAGTTLTRKDMLSELPFGNVTVVMALSGADLRAALENAVSRIEDKAGRFAQISGMRFSYAPAKPKGARVLAVTVGGKPLDNARTYKVATNDYIARGGDGYAVFKRGKVIIDAAGGTLMATQVINHVARLGTIAPKVEGRITAK